MDHTSMKVGDQVRMEYFVTHADFRLVALLFQQVMSWLSYQN